MELEQLVAFERVVREGSFSKAAWALGIAQPTVSARIAALERSVGGALFKRGRKVALTERGVGFLPYARRILTTVEDGLEAARLSGSGMRGQLNVGVLRSLSGGLLGPVALEFAHRYPEVEFRMREGDHWSLVEWLCDGLTDLALICWPCLDPQLADMTPLFTLREETVFTVSSQHPLATKGRVTRAEILEHCRPFLLLRWWQNTPLEITQLAAQSGFAVDVPNETGRYLAAFGQAGGFFSKPTIQPDLQAGRVVELEVTDLPPIARETALVHLSRHTQISSAAQNFAGLLRHEALRQGLIR
jgi:LysR family transcriptional regulator, low CO2-responsive transcriptional regulator